MRLIPTIISFLFISSLIAAAPSDEVVMSCFTGEAITSRIKVKALSTTNIIIDGNYLNKYSATLFNDHGLFGSATVGKDFFIIYKGKPYSINNAIPILNTKENVMPFSPTLVEWFEIKEGTSRYFCVSSNFDGLGRSGKNQYVKFGYFLHTNPTKTTKHTKIYFAIADISQKTIK